MIISTSISFNIFKSSSASSSSASYCLPLSVVAVHIVVRFFVYIVIVGPPPLHVVADVRRRLVAAIRIYNPATT
ncbi:hypothetical protein AAMO2058_001232500 [Amorphochlora amoebiformis]